MPRRRPSVAERGGRKRHTVGWPPPQLLCSSRTSSCNAGAAGIPGTGGSPGQDSIHISWWTSSLSVCRLQCVAPVSTLTVLYTPANHGTDVAGSSTCLCCELQETEQRLDVVREGGSSLLRCVVAAVPRLLQYAIDRESRSCYSFYFPSTFPSSSSLQMWGQLPSVLMHSCRTLSMSASPALLFLLTSVSISTKFDLRILVCSFQKLQTATNACGIRVRVITPCLQSCCRQGRHGLRGTQRSLSIVERGCGAAAHLLPQDSRLPHYHMSNKLVQDETRT